MIRTIIKRNGTKEPYIAEKINGWGIWSSENLKGVDWSEVVLNTVSSLPFEVTSTELQKSLIDYCLSKKTWDYNRMAGRLYTALIVREIHGSDTYPTVKELHQRMQEYGLMEKLNYSDEEYKQIEKIIKHKNNLKLPQYALNQNRWKYALRDKVNGVEFETTQFIYMRMAMTICEEVTDKSKRIQEIEELYDEFTNQRINVPTPYYVNLGTKLKGFASCFPSGSVVTMLHGFKNIEDVKVGDYVVTHNNRVQRVYHTQAKPYKGKFVSINSVATMKDELRPTEEHRIYGIKCVGNGIQFTRRGYESQREWIRADNLRHGDFVKLVYNDNVIEHNKTIWDIISEHELIKGKYQLNEDNTISKILKYHELGDEYKQPIVKNIDVFNIDMFRMFGYYLAEGSITYPKRGDGSSFIQFTMNSNDIDFINDIDGYLNSIGANFKIHVNPNDGSTKIISYSKVMLALFEIMCGIKFDGKILHKDLTTSDYELQKHLLSGVIRGDGTAVKSGYILVLHNETLIRQLRDIALRCKIRVNLKTRKLRYKTIPYSLTFLADCDFSFIKLVNKNITKIKDKRMIGHNVLFLDDGAYTRVKEIHSYDDECEVYDLSVETDASFGISGVAVHNCNVMTTLDTAKSLATGDHIAYMMTVASAGIGYHLKTRSIGDPIKNGLIKHQGKVPYIRANIGAVGANTQNCYAVGTKVLTDKGFVDFRDVTADTVIAQVENDGTISYTNPLDVIKHHYNGKMISFSLNNPKKRNNEKLLVTPNHRMVYHKNIHCKGGNRKEELVSLGYRKTDKNYYHSSEYFVDSASDIDTNRSVLFDFGANAIGEKSLTDFDKLCIAYQADGSTRYAGNFAYTFHFSKKRKVQRLTQLLENCGIEYTLSITKNNTFNIYAKIGKKMYKDFKHFDLTEKSKQWCLDFLNELQYWDGGKCDTKNVDTFSYFTINYENIEFVQAVASMCSVYTSISIGNIGKENHQPLYEIYINPNKHNTTLRTYTKTYVDYDDFVYCVTVPTGRIIVKYNDNTFVCGNSRGGSTTVYVNAYDPEIETLMKLKNPNTPLSKQARGADYSVGFNGFLIKKAIANQEIALFSYKDAPKLYELMYSDDTKAFEKEYQKFIDSDLPRTMVSARKIVGDMLAESFDTGRVYEHFTDTINTHTPFKDKIYQSNLCMTGDQYVISNYGLKTVKELYDMGCELELFDGKKVVKSSPMKLRERNQDVYKITLKNGMTHTVTDYHKVMTDKGLVECKNLNVGDKVSINTNISGLFGNVDMVDEAFLLGLYLGDGTQTDEYICIDVWENKTDILKDDIPDWIMQGTFETQISFIKGLFYTDGTFSINDKSNSLYLSITQTNLEFLKKVQIILNNMGLNFSLFNGSNGGLKEMPNHKDGYSLYETKPSYRLVCGSLYTCIEFERLTGFISFRNKQLPEPIKQLYKPKSHSKVVSIEYVGKEDVYCPTVESDEHLFVANGFITSNCAEITLPTYGFTDVPQLYSEHDETLNFTKIVTDKGEFLINNYIYVKLADGTEKLSQRLYDGDETVEYGTIQSIETSHSPEIGLCNIGGIVVSNIKNDEQYAKTTYWVLRLIRYGILNSEYVFKNLEQTAKARMSAGVGIVGLAHLMAKNKLSYSSQEGKNFIHELAETHAWHLYNASLKIGQEFGNAEWMYKTKWVDGWTPIKTYNKNVDKLVTVGNKRDWDDLSRRIVENNGMAFSVCVAHMPAESCMDIDTKIKTENGIMSLKEIFALTGRDIEKELLEMNRSMDGGKWFKLDKPINVYTLAGLKPLTDVWLNGVTNYIEIELESGDVMRVTHHHKFLVRDENGKTCWKMAIDLNENDDIVNVNEPIEQVA